MEADTSQLLTPRQKAVMERIDRRVPIKVIANDLSVSETRINQHIRALKDIFGAESLNELVELYRSSGLYQGEGKSASPYRKGEYRNNQLPDTNLKRHERSRNDEPAKSAGSRAPSAFFSASGVGQSEPHVVPGVLDGDNAVLLRLAVIVGIAFGILAAVVLSVTAALALSEAMDGRISVPVEN